MVIVRAWTHIFPSTQLVSSLRAALAAGVAPTLSMAGGSLATTFLESGLAAGDSQVGIGDC